MLLIALGCTSGESAETGDTHDGAPTLRLALPLTEPDLFEVVVGVDHDPEVQSAGLDQAICTDYAGRGFPHCYDEHDGSDYILHGSFSTMDAGSVAVIAAAPGQVTRAEDGHYDRCHGDLGTGAVDCDGYEMIANAVIVEHESGHQTWYWHLMMDSVRVRVGDWVETGEELGRVGSSGQSSQPHLHFELQDGQGQVIDPYSGEYSQPESWWCIQGGLDELPGPCDLG